jgi:hypothetical protein
MGSQARKALLAAATNTHQQAVALQAPNNQQDDSTIVGHALV